MSLKLSALEKAVAQLEVALEYAESDVSQNDPHLPQLLRSAAIQAFEYTYELSHKMLRRYLASIDPNPDVVMDLDFPGLIRAGYARGLLSEELEAWRTFRADRGATSHTYDDGTARKVFEKIPRFLKEARYLLHSLQARQGK
jgi:nucleotidyltransferase substrate binding protein (TIGR01987 family)